MTIIITHQTCEDKGQASSASKQGLLAEPHKEIQVRIAPLNYEEVFANATWLSLCTSSEPMTMGKVNQKRPATFFIKISSKRIYASRHKICITFLQIYSSQMFSILQVAGISDTSFLVSCKQLLPF